MFIPYSTRAAWCMRYPNAVPYVECVDVVVDSDDDAAADSGGNSGVVMSTVVRGYPLWNPNVNTVTDIPREVVEAAGYHGAHDDGDAVLAQSLLAAASGGAEGGGTNTNKRPREDKLISGGILNNAQRAELHSEIYSYFTWLRTQVKAEGGRGKKSVGGMSSDGLKEVLRSLGEALPGAKSGGGGGGAAASSGEEQPTPFLEEALFAKLKHRVDSGIGSSVKRYKKASGGSVVAGKKVRKEKGPLVTWEERLKQLTEFGEEHGHYDVPQPLDEEENEDEMRFYNWVQKIHYELRGELFLETLLVTHYK